MIVTRAITVYRALGTTRVNGRTVANYGPGETVTVRTIQPLSAKQLQALPEARRASGESYNVYTDLDVTLNTVKSNSNPDLVELRGENYEVFSEEIHDNGIMDHKLYVILRKTGK